MGRQFIKLLLGLSLLPFAAITAKADFRICNSTQELVGVAIGYRAPSGWISEGWWRISPAKCETIISGDLTSRFYYIHAEDARAQGRWEGNIDMCVQDTKFKINGVDNCFVRGFQRTGFQEIDTGTQTSWMVQLADPKNPSSNNAMPGSDKP